MAYSLFLGALLPGALFTSSAEGAGAVPPPASAPETEAQFIDRVWLVPRHSLMTGDMVVKMRDWYGLEPLWYLTVTGAETSMGRPEDALSRVYNFGCMRAGINKNTPWARLASGTIVVAGKTWWTFPDAWTGCAALGRLLKVGPTSRPGYYLERLRAEDWDGFAVVYYGRVTGLAAYIDNLERIAASVRAKAQQAGFAW